jgi:hypothetical protein
MRRRRKTVQKDENVAYRPIFIQAGHVTAFVHQGRSKNPVANPAMIKMITNCNTA